MGCLSVSALVGILMWTLHSNKFYDKNKPNVKTSYVRKFYYYWFCPSLATPPLLPDASSFVIPLHHLAVCMKINHLTNKPTILIIYLTTSLENKRRSSKEDIDQEAAERLFYRENNISATILFDMVFACL